MQKTTIFQILLVLTVGIILGCLFKYLYPMYKIEVDDQPVSEAIVVRSLTLGKGGFVVVSVADFDDNLTGYSDYLTPGKYSNLSIELYPAQDRPGVEPGTRLKVTIYEDNGEKIFDKGLDKPARNFLGQHIEEYVYLK